MDDVAGSNQQLCISDVEQLYLNALRAYTATVPMTQYDVPEVSRRFRPHLPLHFAIQIAEK